MAFEPMSPGIHLLKITHWTELEGNAFYNSTKTYLTLGMEQISLSVCLGFL